MRQVIQSNIEVQDVVNALQEAQIDCPIEVFEQQNVYHRKTGELLRQEGYFVSVSVQELQQFKGYKVTRMSFKNGRMILDIDTRHSFILQPSEYEQMFARPTKQAIKTGLTSTEKSQWILAHL